MYRIVKDISSTCGSDDCYATKSGWYIVDDLHDGRVKISEYNAAKNTWSDNIIIDEDILVINGEVGSAAISEPVAIPRTAPSDSGFIIMPCMIKNTPYINTDLLHKINAKKINILTLPDTSSKRMYIEVIE